MRTLAIYFLAFCTVGLASDGSGRRVTVERELVVAPIIHADERSSHTSNAQPNRRDTKLRASTPVASHAKRSRVAHAAERPSLLARFGRAIGITVRQR